MRSGYKSLAALCLSAAMASPLMALAKPQPQDDHERHEQEEREHKVYDPVHKDYHNWDQREDQVYRKWLEAKHATYVDFDRLDQKRQEEYWKWRHEHEDDRH